MIPPIIHQTWKDECVPGHFAGYLSSWARFNPSWQRTLWTDRMLVEFVEQNYPELLDVYCSYPEGVCRADAGRYMLLHKFGGLYADIDVECLAPLTQLASEDRIVLCQEPPSHWQLHAPYRSHPFLLFNGVMASPARHPFWREVLDRLPETRHATDILDMTGPCFLTGIYLGYGGKDKIAVHDCHLFTPTNDRQREEPQYGDEMHTPLTRHYWQGSWFRPERPGKRITRSLTTAYHRLRYHLTKGAALDPGEAQRRIESNVLNQHPPTGDKLAILVPVRDGASHLEPFIEAISATDLMSENTKLVFCEGDSIDGTREKLDALAPDLRRKFRDVVVLHKDVGTRFEHAARADRRIQRARRAGIADVRNHLIDHGLDDTDDWALWIDIDVWRFPADIFQRLRSADARIVVPNCVKFSGGPSFDLNSFVTSWDYPDRFYYRHFRSGLFQPPARARGRFHLDALRHSERVELDGVGGTMLLVDASLHRAGLNFPRIPYKDLIETEAFGVLARDVGVRPVGLPRVEVMHVP